MMKKSMISIRLTVHTEDEAVGMAAADTTSVEEATVVTATIAVATVATATITWATVAMATMAATTITAAQTGEATVEKVEEDTKASDKRNAMSATNQDAGPTSIP
jgi:hypothetical protein